MEKSIRLFAVLSVGTVLSLPSRATDVEQPLDQKTHLNMSNTPLGNKTQQTSQTRKLSAIDPIKFANGLCTMVGLGVSLYCHKRIPMSPLKSAYRALVITSAPTVAYVIHNYMNMQDTNDKFTSLNFKLHPPQSDAKERFRNNFPFCLGIFETGASHFENRTASVALLRADRKRKNDAADDSKIDDKTGSYFENVPKPVNITYHSLLTDSQINSFLKQYPGLSHKKHGPIHRYRGYSYGLRHDFNITTLDSVSQEHIKLDLDFLEKNPNMPLENLHLHDDNYPPKHTSQRE